MPNSTKTAVVTGAASGLGLGIANALSDAGYRLVLVDINQRGLDEVSQSIPNSHFFRCDVSSKSEWEKLSDFVGKEFGGVDVLVNNAAIYNPKMVVDETVDGFQRLFEVNQLSVLLGMQAAVLLMKERKSGSIINISSTGGLRGYPGTIAYAATKWAVRGMTKVAAVELAQYGIRVNVIFPGLFDTPMARENTPEMLENHKKSIPMGRLGKPSEIGDAVVFLAGAHSSYMTGSEITVDGAASV